jgi:hypothetical protein
MQVAQKEMVSRIKSSKFQAPQQPNAQLQAARAWDPRQKYAQVHKLQDTSDAAALLFDKQRKHQGKVKGVTGVGNDAVVTDNTKEMAKEWRDMATLRASEVIWRTRTCVHSWRELLRCEPGVLDRFCMSRSLAEPALRCRTWCFPRSTLFARCTMAGSGSKDGDSGDSG